MKKVEAYIKPHRLSDVNVALQKIKGFSGMSVGQIRGFGRREPISAKHTRSDDLLDFSPYMRIEIFCRDELVGEIVSIIREKAHTGLRGDGKIYVSPIEMAVRILNGESGEQAV